MASSPIFLFFVLQEAVQPDWVEELSIDYDVYMGGDTDPDALRQIHLYRVLWTLGLNCTSGETKARVKGLDPVLDSVSNHIKYIIV